MPRIQNLTISNTSQLIWLHIRIFFTLTTLNNQRNQSTPLTIFHSPLRFIAILAFMISVDVCLRWTAIDTDIWFRVMVLLYSPAIRNTRKAISSKNIWRVLFTACYTFQAFRIFYNTTISLSNTRSHTPITSFS